MAPYPKMVYPQVTVGFPINNGYQLGRLVGIMAMDGPTYQPPLVSAQPLLVSHDLWLSCWNPTPAAIQPKAFELEAVAGMKRAGGARVLGRPGGMGGWTLYIYRLNYFVLNKLSYGSNLLRGWVLGFGHKMSRMLAPRLMACGCDEWTSANRLVSGPGKEQTWKRIICK